MTKFYFLYAKFEGQDKFKALDLTEGIQVNNLIRATMIPSEKLGYIEDIIRDNPNVEFKVKLIK
jgi:hypothetical protein